MILPLGSGGFPAIPSSQNEPLWEPGRFPLSLAPHIAYDDALWMVSQTRAYSSPDGLTWTEQAKTDWGNGSTNRSSTSRVECGYTEAWITRLVPS